MLVESFLGGFIIIGGHEQSGIGVQFLCEMCAFNSTAGIISASTNHNRHPLRGYLEGFGDNFLCFTWFYGRRLSCGTKH